MLRFIVLTTLLATSALAYNGGYGRKGYSAPAPAYQQPAYKAPAPSYQPTYQQEQPKSVQLPVQSNRNIQYVDVQSSYSEPAPLNIDMPAPAAAPINFAMRSRSSPLNVENYHEGDQGSYKATSSEDAPHVRVHTVTRPVVQQVNEIIAPVRKITQQVQPVQEQVDTQVAKQGGYAKPSYAKPAAPAPAYPKQAPAAPAYPKPAPAAPAYPKPALAAAPAYTKPKPKPSYAPAPSRRYNNNNY